MAGSTGTGLDTNEIKNWRSTITLIVFVLANIIVLFPFKIPVWIPRILYNAFWNSLAGLRIVSPRDNHAVTASSAGDEKPENGRESSFIKKHFPMNFVTGPLIAVLFLLAILAIGRDEVYGGTVGSDHIYPLDVMAFFISLAYIAVSLDASGLIRWLAFKVLQKAGKHGRRLFLYLYIFFFSLASFIGNDPIILSGTPFLAYMTRVAENIKHPRAWIHTQFTLANIGSAVLVTSNPTNLVLAGAFKIKFIVYTANIIVPIIATTILLYPFLLYINFHNDSLIPRSIALHELPDESKNKKPFNPNIPFSKGISDEDEEDETEESKLLSLEEVLNPYLDKFSAGFGAGIMAVTLIVILAINASIGEGVPAYWVTLPAAVITFCRDVFSGWRHRAVNRDIAKKGKETVDRARRRKENQVPGRSDPSSLLVQSASDHYTTTTELEKEGTVAQVGRPIEPSPSPEDTSGTISSKDIDEKGNISATSKMDQHQKPRERATLVSVVDEKWMWCRETFPTVTTVLRNLPYPLVPFALCMFVLVQGLVTKGWIAVFAYGWSHWVRLTGTIGAIGGMAFLSIILCNFAGTNIGTAILLCRVVQAWVQIHSINNEPISQRTFWATIYSMTIGLNFGAFSTCFSASLAGLLWRDILKRKRIIVKELDFARVNVNIIAFTTVVACAVLIGQAYITRNETPYQGSG